MYLYFLFLTSHFKFMTLHEFGNQAYGLRVIVIDIYSLFYLHAAFYSRILAIELTQATVRVLQVAISAWLVPTPITTV